MPTLSHNELFALLKRAFESLLGHDCDYEAFAEEIVWLECHGLAGTGMLRGYADQMQNGALISAPVQPIRSADGVFHIDAHGGSLICAADMLADLSISHGKSRGLCRIEIANFRDPLAVIPQLYRIRCSGIYAAAWMTGDDAAETSYAAGLGPEELPDLSSWDAFDTAQPQGILHLVSADNAENLREAIGSSLTNWPAAKVTSAMLEQQYYDSLDGGIAAFDLGFLYDIADKVLVEASEASRLGAGE